MLVYQIWYGVLLMTVMSIWQGKNTCSCDSTALVFVCESQLHLGLFNHHGIVRCLLLFSSMMQTQPKCSTKDNTGLMAKSQATHVVH